jgi:hypothetical protein
MISFVVAFGLPFFFDTIDHRTAGFGRKYAFSSPDRPGWIERVLSTQILSKSGPQFAD